MDFEKLDRQHLLHYLNACVSNSSFVCAMCMYVCCARVFFGVCTCFFVQERMLLSAQLNAHTLWAIFSRSKMNLVGRLAVPW